MPWLSLLGGQPEFIGCVLIESDESRLRYLARKAQAAWFEDPESVDRKREYAYALKDWAKATRNPGARAHAERLLSETEAGRPS